MDEQVNQCLRIMVVGTSATGKSTFARALAERKNLSYIELDDFFWQDNWQQTDKVKFQQRVLNRIQSTSAGYIVDGNYSTIQALLWSELDIVIWLDFPFHINLSRSIRRAITRVVTQDRLWSNSNNTENLAQLFSKDSIVIWMMKTYWKNKKKYSHLIQKQSQIKWIRVRTPEELKHLLHSF